MRIGIVACDILKGEIEFLTKDDPDFVLRKYIEFALHENPENMREVIIKTVNELEGQVDAILLGYATCQSLQNISSELRIPTVVLPGADCIDALLGAEEYAREKKVCTGTWFSTPGWAKEGINGLVKEMHLDSMEGYDPSFFLDMLFASYQRCLHIDTGIGDNEEYTRMSKEFADQLKLRLDCRSCGLKALEDAIVNVKKLAC